MKLKKRRKILNNRNKSVTKSIILKKLADSYPGFLKKDLEKILSITLDEIRNALKRDSRIELRNIFTLIPKIQKEGFRRNPKTGEKIFINQKKNIGFKLSKNWLKKIND
tara:strand:- start:498 stop:824 length:327 start_codon:yes stop_codon:yes gene_type:complete